MAITAPLPTASALFEVPERPGPSPPCLWSNVQAPSPATWHASADVGAWTTNMSWFYWGISTSIYIYIYAYMVCIYIYVCVIVYVIYIYIYIIVKDSSMAMFTLFDFIGSSWSESAWPQTQNWTNSSRKSVMVRMARSERCMEILCPQTSGSEKKMRGFSHGISHGYLMFMLIYRMIYHADIKYHCFPWNFD